MTSGNGRAAEPSLRIGSREELVYLLGEASEIEHGLLCEYLYAQFSLKRSVDEGVSQEQLAASWVTSSGGTAITLRLPSAARR